MLGIFSKKLVKSEKIFVFKSNFSVLNENELHISESAKRRLSSMVVPDKPNSFLRVIVDSGGCKGYLVKFEVENNPLNDDDFAYTQNDIPKLVIDELSLKLLSGSTIDYVNEIARQAFVVAENPNAASSCGCKVSFSKE